MADKQTQAAKRVIKKLSALRGTLTKSEREVLDRIVTSAKLDFGPEEPEVQGHMLKEGQVSGAKTGALTGRQEVGAKTDAKTDALTGAVNYGVVITGAKYDIVSI